MEVDDDRKVYWRIGLKVDVPIANYSTQRSPMYVQSPICGSYGHMDVGQSSYCYHSLVNYVFELKD